jgi:hypothetical protein
VNFLNTSLDFVYVLVLKISTIIFRTPCKYTDLGRAIAQAFSPWLLTAAAGVKFQLRSYGICGGLSGTDHIFSVYFGFPCQFTFHHMTHFVHPSEAGTLIHLQSKYQGIRDNPIPRRRNIETWVRLRKVFF